jgi:outer membrane lipoprotein SlyB
VDDSGAVAIPRGSPATLVIREAAAGKVKANELVLDLRSVSVGGHDYNVETNSITQKGKSNVGANKRTAIFTGGGSALGAIIGAIAGGGKGAAIGAAAGAGAGAGTQILTRGSVKVPAETVLTFRLQAPLQLEAQ